MGIGVRTVRRRRGAWVLCCVALVLSLGRPVEAVAQSRSASFEGTWVREKDPLQHTYVIRRDGARYRATDTYRASANRGSKTFTVAMGAAAPAGNTLTFKFENPHKPAASRGTETMNLELSKDGQSIGGFSYMPKEHGLATFHLRRASSRPAGRSPSSAKGKPHNRTGRPLAK